MEVVKITKKQAAEFVVNKHYSRKESIFWDAYGLLIDGYIEGVVVYGQPSPAIQKHAFKDRNFKLYELSRLVVQTDRKNAASFLVGNSLKMIDQPCAVVSYADSAHGHSGIIYQATNWIYTGATVSHDKLYIIDGVPTHPMSIIDKFKITNPTKWAKDNNIETIKPKEKHRYFYFCGNRKFKKEASQKLSYQIINEYPKSDKKTYDDGEKIIMPYYKIVDIFDGI